MKQTVLKCHYCSCIGYSLAEPSFFFFLSSSSLQVMSPSSRYDKPGKPTYRMDDEMKKRNNNASSFESMRIATSCVAPYSMWVEGDNRSNSYDSQQHGSISKHLLVGVAEYVVWPPTRFQKLSKQIESPVAAQPYAYWP